MFCGLRMGADIALDKVADITATIQTQLGGAFLGLSKKRWRNADDHDTRHM